MIPPSPVPSYPPPYPVIPESPSPPTYPSPPVDPAEPPPFPFNTGPTFHLWPWCPCRTRNTSYYVKYNSTLSDKNNVCFTMYAQGTCDPNVFACCEFEINQVDFVVNGTCIGNVNNITVNNELSPFSRYIRQGPLVKVKDLQFTYQDLVDTPVNICLSISSPCNDVSSICKNGVCKYGIFQTSGDICCYQGFV